MEADGILKIVLNAVVEAAAEIAVVDHAVMDQDLTTEVQDVMARETAHAVTDLHAKVSVMRDQIIVAQDAMALVIRMRVQEIQTEIQIDSRMVKDLMGIDLKVDNLAIATNAGLAETIKAVIQTAQGQRDKDRIPESLARPMDHVENNSADAINMRLESIHTDLITKLRRQRQA